MANLIHGLETLEIGATTWREILNYNLDELDPNRIFVGLAEARPEAGSEGRFWFSSDTALLYYDDGESWIRISGGSVAGSFVLPTLFLSGRLEVADAGNYLIAQKRMYVPADATISAVQVVGVDGLDVEATGNSVINVSDTDHVQGGLPQTIALTLAHGAAYGRQTGSIDIVAGSYLYLFASEADGGHYGVQIALEVQ